MLPTITYEWDSRELKVFRGGKIEDALGRAMHGAGGLAIRRIKTTSIKDVREKKTLKAGRLRAGLPLIYPSNNRGKAAGSLEWIMKVSGRGIALAEYQHRQTKAGVLVTVNKGRPKLVKGAFVARMKSGHKGIFIRRTVAGKKSRRLPIDEFFSTRISDVFGDAGFIPKLHALGAETVSSEFSRLFSVGLQKLGRAA